MKALEKAGYLAHARTPSFKWKMERARGCIRHTLALSKRPFVSWSAGKDSSAMLYLVAEEAPEISVRILTGGETRLLYPELDEHIKWWRERFPKLDLQEILVDHVFTSGWENADFAEMYRSFFDEWEKYLYAGQNWDAVFIGLRKSESANRRFWLSRRIKDCDYAILRYSAKGNKAGILRSCPLDLWTEQDIGALFALHDIPLLGTYERDGLEARTKMRIGRQAMRFGQLEELRGRNPAGYNKLIERFPELMLYCGGQLVFKDGDQDVD